MTTRAALVVAALGAASSAFGQVQTQGNVHYTLGTQIYGQGLGSPWSSPVPNGNGDGVLNPGEGVLFRITVSMSIEPGNATTAFGGTLGGPLTWNPSILNGSSGVGTNAGFWDGDLNLTGIGNGSAAGARGTWSDGTTAYASSVRRRLLVATASNNSGIVGNGGAALTDINPGQFGANTEHLDHTNNFVVFQGLWVPDDYSIPSVTWQLSLGSLGLMSSYFAADSNYDNGYTLPVPLHVTSSYGPAATVQVVPAPAGVLLLGLSGLAATRRRRPSGH